MDGARLGAGASRRGAGQPESHGRRRARSGVRASSSEGFHTYDGLRHAEIIALEAAGPAARGATLYINLEPCCHTGRTGPCTRALIAAGVARVVAAMADPNPAVAGRGFRELHKAGIEVISGVLESQAQQLNEAFAIWITARRPFVTLKSAMTLDGHLVLPQAARQRRSPLDYLPGLARGSSAHAPRLRRHADRHRHRAGRRSACSPTAPACRAAARCCA